MPFDRPTLSELRARIAADIEARTGEDATSRGSLYNVLAQAEAGAAHGLHGHQAWIVRQMFDETAEEANLERRAGWFAIDRIAATAATGTATATGTDGAQILVGTLLQTSSSVAYQVTATATIVAGTASIALQAVEPGADGNLAAGASLTFISPVLDVDSVATVAAAGLTGGADIETVEQLRARLLERKRQPPMGGAAHDYIAWAKAAHADVTRAWCYPLESGVGSVTVRFVTDNLPSPIPSAAVVNAVQAYVDEQRPVTVKQCYVLAPVETPLNLVFTRLSPNDAATRTAVEAELADYLYRAGEPGGSLLLSDINAAISLACDDHRIDLTDDIVLENHQLPVVGVSVWP